MFFYPSSFVRLSVHSVVHLFVCTLVLAVRLDGFLFRLMLPALKIQKMIGFAAEFNVTKCCMCGVYLDRCGAVAEKFTYVLTKFHTIKGHQHTMYTVTITQVIFTVLTLAREMHPPFELCGGIIDFCSSVSPLAALCIVFRDNASRERLGTKSFDVPVEVIDFLPPVESPAVFLSCIFDARQMVTTIST